MSPSLRGMQLNIPTIRSGAAPTVYLLLDEFTADEAAPVTSPRTSIPGPGTLTFTQTDGQFSTSGGALVFAQQTTPNFAGSDQSFTSAVLSRVAGRMVRLDLTITGGSGNRDIHMAWYGNSSATRANSTGALYLVGTSIAAQPEEVAILLGFTILNTAVKVYSVLRSTGAFLFLSGGTLTTPTLLWVSDVGAGNAYAGLSTIEGAGNLRDIVVTDLPAPFATDYGIATLNTASPADATEYTGDASGVIDLTVTAPGVLDGSATTRCGFYYRADADLTPAWHCYVAGDGAFYLDSIAGDGTRTNRITVAAVIAGGGTRTLRVITTGSKHNAYTRSGATWTKRGAEINVSLNDAVTTIVPSVPAGWSVANLRSYPRTSAAYSALDVV